MQVKKVHKKMEALASPRTWLFDTQPPTHLQLQIQAPFTSSPLSKCTHCSRLCFLDHRGHLVLHAELQKTASNKCKAMSNPVVMQKASLPQTPRDKDLDFTHVNTSCRLLSQKEG